MGGIHAKLSASATKRWATCPGSAAFIERNPIPDKSTRDSALGTAAHSLLEMTLKEGYASSAAFEDLEIEADGFKFVVDRDMYEAVDCAVEYVYGRLEELGQTHINLLLEHHVVPLPHRNDTGGTVDICIDNWPVSLEVVDYKHGAGIFVPVEKNPQLRSYATGMVRELSESIKDSDYELFRYTICQPRHHLSPSDGIMSEAVTPEELSQWVEWLDTRASEVDLARELMGSGAGLPELFANNFLSAGEDGEHCRFCPIKYKCPALFQITQKHTQIDFKEAIEEDTIIEVPQGVSLARAVHWIPVIRTWCDSCMEEAKSQLILGEKVEGQKLVEGRSTRTWKETLNKTAIATDLQDKYNLCHDDLFIIKEPTLKSGPQIEKMIPKEQRSEFNDTYLMKPTPQLTMVPESDRRKAISITGAREDFEEFTE